MVDPEELDRLRKKQDRSNVLWTTGIIVFIVAANLISGNGEMIRFVGFLAVVGGGLVALAWFLEEVLKR